MWDVDDYMHGWCQVWALNNYQPGDKFFTIVDYDYDIDGYTLVHCGLYRDGLYIDSIGEHNDINDVLNEFDYEPEMEIEILELSEFKQFCKDYKLPTTQAAMDKFLNKYYNNKPKNNESKDMKQNTIKLNETQLKKIVAESVKRVLSEGSFYTNDFGHRLMANEEDLDIIGTILRIERKPQTVGRGEIGVEVLKGNKYLPDGIRYGITLANSFRSNIDNIEVGKTYRIKGYTYNPGGFKIHFAEKLIPID